MKEISRTKKSEVAHYYILGYPYSDIENRSRVSHGSVVNIVKELCWLTTWLTWGNIFGKFFDLKRSSLRDGK